MNAWRRDMSEDRFFDPIVREFVIILASKEKEETNG